MKNNKIITTIFSNSGDDDLILENILCLLDSLPEAEISVIDDIYDPCSPRTKTLTEIMGIRWKSGRCQAPALSLKRIEYILKEMLSRSDQDDDILVKIDPDTALLDARELHEFAKSKKVLWACGCPDTKIFGSLFALKASAAKYLLDNIRLLDQEDDTPWDIKIKDFVLGLHRSRKKDVFSLWWLSGTLLPWARFDWSTYPDVSAYRRHAVVSVGRPSSPGCSREARGEIFRNLRLDRE